MTPSAAGAGATGYVDLTDFTDGRYIVFLDEAPVATYDGGVSGIAPTTPGNGRAFDATSKNSRAYANYLEAKQDKLAKSVGAEVATSYTVALNGFAADLTADQAATLAGMRGVTVEADQIYHLDATPSTEFLGLGSGADGTGGVWDATGGRESAGEGIVVGILDTGIAPENASFAGDALGTTPGDEPYLDGDVITYAKADGGVFTGTCEVGEQFEASDCSTKIVGAQYFVDGFGAGSIGDASVGEYVSPRDGDGHGSHTASTAAGDPVGEVTVGSNAFGGVVGVAPAAKIAAYKVCWSGPDPASQDDDGCAGSDLLAGINAAVADGVDVINFSIGGGAATSTVVGTDYAFFNAAAAGVFVAASAGNSGPSASTLDNAAPWITTVAASTIPSYEATATTGDGAKAVGGSVTVPADGVSGDFVRGDQVKTRKASASEALLCAAGSLDPALVTGKIVYCDRGAYARVDKSAEVARAGGIGMIMANPSPNSIDLDLHSVPTIHVPDTERDALYEYAGTAGATISFAQGREVGTAPATPQVAGFSSRGPVLADGSDVLKPDISAPGVAILAAGANADGEEGTYQFLSGTSMSSPHIAGLAAFYLGEAPTESPMAVKSAMMTSAYDTVDAAGDAVTDPFTQGAGHVDPTSFFAPGFVYDSDVYDWAAYIEALGYADYNGIDPVDPSDLNQASIAVGSLTGTETVTRTATATQAGTFTPTINGLAGFDVDIEPSSLVFGAAGEEASYTVTFTRTDAPVDQFTTGSIDWVSGATVVHSPVAVQPVSLDAPSDEVGTGTTGSVDVSVTPGFTGDIPLTVAGLAPAEQLKVKKGGPNKAYSGSGSTGDEATWFVEIPEGVTFQRWDLDAYNDAADLDLLIYQLDGKRGTRVALWYSATGDADERVDLLAPEPGYYEIVAQVYAGQDEMYDLDSYTVMPGGVGDLSASPNPLPGVQGEEATYTLSWSGLDAGETYLGYVAYGESGFGTALEVGTE
ncbi:S8 family serine peptidase [Agromyces sp. SYSU T00194]|uniref:S8 family serine peptidase n=1 Tax=Agromyces chitinivorans TaxID=3158560 RepID=UPI00339A5462